MGGAHADNLQSASADQRTLRLQVEGRSVAFSTGGDFDGGDATFKRLRSELLASPTVRAKLPEFVRRYRDTYQFWQFIKHEYAHYAERRAYIWDQFRPLIEFLEVEGRSPSDAPIAETLEAFDPETVHAIWQKALDRRTSDPEGAITAARTLLETVCKHVLDDLELEYDDKADLPKLWATCAKALNLSPSQHSEEAFKAILGSCQTIVQNLGHIRNKVSDAHGQGRRPIKPKPRHAELAVNLAGSMASFLVATWKERSDKGSESR